jgi:hypothetical protein
MGIIEQEKMFSYFRKSTIVFGFIIPALKQEEFSKKKSNMSGLVFPEIWE